MADDALAALGAAGPSPRILFVLGKGGVGRSTVAAALGLRLAQAGQRVLVLQWAVADAIGPWFGGRPAGFAPQEVAPRLSVCNFALAGALRSYFVDHLHLGFVYRGVLRAGPVARLIEVAPGIQEMFFLGELWWLTTLAEREAGLRFDRVVVDAPATGHGASLLDVPATLAAMGAAGLLAVETRRVQAMLADAARTGVVVVAAPEPLVVDETLELLPRLRARLGRDPLLLLVNRSAGAIAGEGDSPAWLEALATRLSPISAGALVELHRELRARVTTEAGLRALAAGRTARGVVSLPDLPGLGGGAIVARLAAVLGGPS
jgi:hypothetical protein